MPGRRASKPLFRPVHVEERFLVVDKRSGCLVHRTPTSREPTLVDALYAAYGFVHPVHRLDRFVSGLLVFARDEDAAAHLRAQFADHRADRRYLAAVEGVLRETEGRFQSRLRLNEANYRMHRVKKGPGRDAITHWWLVEAFRAENATLVEVALETGVKNQIRVHFADAGHPILGEQKYLDPGRPGARSTQRRRLFLHAAQLSLRHPDDDRPRAFHAPLPSDLGRWKQQLRGGPRRRPPRPRRTSRRSSEH